MKFAVGVMLTSFGMFWGAEGAGAHWPGDDAALLAIVPGGAAWWRTRSVGTASRERTRSATIEPSDRPGRDPRAGDGERMRRVRAFLLGVWEFVVGDDWRTALGVVLALGLTALLAGTHRRHGG